MSPTRSYRLRPKADADLENIWFYSSGQWSFNQADAYVNDVLSALDDLATGARRGTRVPDFDGILRYPIGSHAIFYQEQSHLIDVVRILHQAMDPHRHLTAT